MAPDGKPSGTAIHATAVAIAGRAILILGRSKSGKSSLAAALIARSSQCVPILLIGDDRLLLRPLGPWMMARAHPRVAGFIERRGLGLVASPFVDQAAVSGIVCLGPTNMPHPDLANFPVLRIVNIGTGDALADEVSVEQVLSWVLGFCDAAPGTQVAAKESWGAACASKD